MKFLDLSITAFIQCKLTEFSAYELCLIIVFFEKNQNKDLPQNLNTFICKFNVPQDTMTFIAFSYVAPIAYITVELEGLSKTVIMWKQVAISSLKVPHPTFFYGEREYLRRNSFSAAGKLPDSTIVHFRNKWVKTEGSEVKKFRGGHLMSKAVTNKKKDVF